MAPASASYRALVDAALRRLRAVDPRSAGPLIDAVVAEAGELMPAMAADGRLDRDDVRRLDAMLRARELPLALDTREALSEINLAAAHAAGDAALARQAAQTRCMLLHAVAQRIDPAQRRAALKRVTRRALDLVAEHGLEAVDPQLVADLHLQAGNVFMRGFGPLDDEVDRGLEHFLRGLEIKRAHGGDPAERQRLEDLMRRAAHYVVDQTPLRSLFGGDPSRAWRRLETALAVLEAVGPAQDAHGARAELLQLALESRLLDAAEPLLQALVQAGDALPPRVAQELPLQHADWLAQRHRPAEALAVLDAAPARDDDQDEPALHAATIRANALRLLGRWDEAEAAFASIEQRCARALAAEPGRVSFAERRLLAQAHLGYLLARRGRTAEAEEWFGRATVGGDQAPTPDAQLRVADLWAMGLYEARQWDEALAKYERVRELRTRIDEATADPQVREGLLGAWALTESRLVELQIRTGRAAQALQTAEAAKSRVLRELARRHVPPHAHAAAPQDARMQALHQAWAQADAEREAAAGAKGSAADPAALRRAEARLAGLRELIERRVQAATFAAAPGDDESIGVDAMLALLPPGNGWGLVCLHAGHEGSAVLIAAPGADGATAAVEGIWLPDWPYARLLDELYLPWEAAARAVFDGDAPVADWHAALERVRRQAHAALWAPVAARLAAHGLRRLLLLPHRLLHLLPWTALQADAGGELLDGIDALCVAPGAALLRTLHRGPPAPTRNALLLGCPDADAPLMGAEAAQLARRCAAQGRAATLHLGAAAHAEALAADGAQAGAVHLACHGIWSPDGLRASGLRLAPLPAGSPALFGQQDGLVPIPALLAQLRLPGCELAMLSACESGLARRSAADEPVSLPLAFLLAGARQVVASLWPVADDATLLLMDDLWQRWLAGTPAAQALLQAQRRLRGLRAADAADALLACRGAPAPGADPWLMHDADAHLTALAAQLRALPAEARPYASPDYWAAFICFGAPAADRPPRS
ncbi:MAG: CHAT domain-containing protein [Burkholderiales bacterium]|nr:CHAT domain-containing protein [Burkholderiales bacterium]